jgi:putative ABC transport system permease protein
MWVPIAFTDNQREDRGTNYLNVLGRLKGGLSLTQAESQFQALAARLREAQGQGNIKENIKLETLKTWMQQSGMRETSWFSFGMTFCVLLIARANLANLQLARTTPRQREFALRAALGGGRERLLKQSKTESVLLALIGCAVAIPLSITTARFAAQHILDMAPGAIIRTDYRPGC